MRLLLEEHIDRALAADLRSVGHDVIAVTERPDLRGSGDGTLLDLAAAERRALATRDYKTLRPLLAERLAVGGGTWGVIFVSRGFANIRSGSGRIRDALAAFLQDHPTDDELRDREVWLTTSS